MQVRGVLALVAGLSTTGCAFVEFESSPYAPSGFDVVYSSQEELTFLSWRLDRRADPGSVSFEWVVHEVARTIDLGAAPFPAAPYPCGNAWCFQFQVEGRLALDAVTLRARHPRFGVFAGQAPSIHEPDRTFDVDPLGVERNAQIDPRRFDWFAEAGIPLVRDYAFRMRTVRCEDAPGPTDSFVSLDEVVEAPPGWTDAPACFEATTRRRDRDGVVVARALVPSAETYLAARELYEAPTITHRTVYGLLFDLAIANSDRCSATRQRIGDAFRDAIEQRDPGAVSVGVFEPEARAGCLAELPERYPVAEMLESVFSSSATTDGPARTVLWIYVSNRPTSPAASSDALLQLLEGTAAIERSPPFLIELALAASSGRSTWSISYRAIEDPTLVPDIATVVTEAVPFRTMLHDPESGIPVAAQSAAPNRDSVKLCQAIPPSAAIALPDGNVRPGQSFPWPADDAVVYRVDLGTQLGVPNDRYRVMSSTVLVEVCARFCNGRAKTANGVVLTSWRDSDVCVGIP